MRIFILGWAPPTTETVYNYPTNHRACRERPCAVQNSFVHFSTRSFCHPKHVHFPFFRAHFEFKFHRSYDMIIAAYAGLITVAKTLPITAQFVSITINRAASEVLTCHLQK